MNKCDILNSFKKFERESNLYTEIHKLNEFLRNNGDKFKNEESIAALKRIKEYLKRITEEHETLRNTRIISKRKFMSNCTHEVLINNDISYNCCICGKGFNYKDIDFNCILIDYNEKYDYYTIIENIKNVIYEICKNEEDILDDFKKYINNDNIRIYRRIK